MVLLCRYRSSSTESWARPDDGAGSGTMATPARRGEGPASHPGNEYPSGRVLRALGFEITPRVVMGKRLK